MSARLRSVPNRVIILCFDATYHLTKLTHWSEDLELPRFYVDRAPPSKDRIIGATERYQLRGVRRNLFGEGYSVTVCYYFPAGAPVAEDAINCLNETFARGYAGRLDAEAEEA